MKISFLIYNVYGIGGTIRSTVNLSSALAAAGHTVEIASVYRNQDHPALSLGPGVTVRPLIEWRRGEPGCARRQLSAHMPSTMWEDAGVAFGGLAPSRLTDERVADYLRRTDADVVIATRPVLNGYLARYGQRRYLRVGQEHVLMEMHNERMRENQNRAIAELDAFVTVSQSDAALYREALPDTGTHITAIPNAVPLPDVHSVSPGTKTIVAAGRLTKVKRYDRLVDAFAKVAPEFPDWSLRIYGRGRQAPKLQRQINRLGLYNQVRLMGPVSPIDTEWAKGELAAVSSDNESFGMTIVEAMHCGLPVVSTDCPYGPGEILTHGGDGLLVPLSGGSNAFADALWIMMSSPERRQAMGRQASGNARRYLPELVAQRYLNLLAELGADSRPQADTSAPAVPLGQRLRTMVRTALGRERARLPHARQESVAPTGPSVRCLATPDGSLVFSLSADTLLDNRPWELLLRRRKDEQRRQIRLPLPPRQSAAGGRVEVLLDRATHSLPEGRWDCYLARPPRTRGAEKTKPRRLRAELVEQGELLTLPPAVTEEGVSSWIPYVTLEGNLSVRTWLRTSHAEVHQLEVGPGSLSATVQLYGAGERQEGQHARTEQHSPEGREEEAPAATDTIVQAVRRQDGRTVSSPAERLPGGRLRFTLPLAPALAGARGERDLWDLRLRSSSTGGPDGTPAPSSTIALGRISGDTTNRKAIDVLPAAKITFAGGRQGTVQPYFTTDNGLALSVRPGVEKPGAPQPDASTRGSATGGEPLAA